MAQKKSISFKTTSYENIINHVKDKNQDDINKFLDSTFGFYTLDKKHRFVLAHYNWHQFASKEKSKGLVTPEENLPIINTMMNNRIKRMFDLINSSEFTFFVFYDPQNFSNMKVDNEKLYFNKIENLRNTLKEKINCEFNILTLKRNEKIKAETLLDLYHSKIS